MLAFKCGTRNTKHSVQGQVLYFSARAQEILKKNHTVQMFIREATLFMRVCNTVLLNPTIEVFFSKQKQLFTRSVYMKLQESWLLLVHLLLV